MKRYPRTTARPFRPYALTWIDFLVIAAIALTFLVIASTTISHAKASSIATLVNDPPTFAAETRHATEEPDLIKARIRLSIGAPWN